MEVLGRGLKYNDVAEQPNAGRTSRTTRFEIHHRFDFCFSL